MLLDTTLYYWLLLQPVEQQEWAAEEFQMYLKSAHWGSELLHFFCALLTVAANGLQWLSLLTYIAQLRCKVLVICPWPISLKTQSHHSNIIHRHSTKAWLFAKVWQISQNVKSYIFLCTKKLASFSRCRAPADLLDKYWSQTFAGAKISKHM